MSVTYPKRELASEAFGDQIDIIEKRLIEQQNMPTLYMNYRRKANNNKQHHLYHQQQQAQQYGGYPKSSFQTQANHSTSYVHHGQNHNQVSFQERQPASSNEPALFGNSSTSHYQPIQDDFANMIGGAGTAYANRFNNQKSQTTFDPFATNYAPNIWGSSSAGNEKSVATVWG